MANTQKNRLEYLFEKHKVIRKMFLAGILINFIFLYQKTCKYLQVCELNDRIIQNHKTFLERITARKYHLLDQVANEGK